MHRIRVKVIAGLLAAAANIAAGQTNLLTYRMVPWADVSDQQMSPLVNMLREDDPAWYYAESAHVIAYARYIRDIESAMAQAEYAYREIGQRLDVVETGRKAHLILIRDEETWNKLVTKAGIRPDGLAFQNGRELFVKISEKVHVSRVPHEMVHFRLRDTYGHLPLWLDEGFALQYGWRVAKVWADGQGAKIVRSLPAIPAERWLSIEALTSAKEYPADAAEAQAYYREAEEITRAIVEKIGLPKAGAFLKAVAGDGTPWRKALIDDFKFTDADFEEMEKTVRTWSTEARDD